MLDRVVCKDLKGVGPKVAEKLEKLGIHTVQDILFHLPSRYEDRTKITPFSQLTIGTKFMIEGEVVAADRPRHGKTRLLVTLLEGHRMLYLRFIHVYQSMVRQMSPGSTLRCFGEVRFGHQGLEMIHPEFEVIRPSHESPLEKCLTPFYATTEGLSQSLWRKLTTQALALMDQQGVEELMPEALMSQNNFGSIQQALQDVHRPLQEADKQQLQQFCHPSQQRLAFEELVAHRLGLLRTRSKIKRHNAIVMLPKSQLTKQFLQELPFEMTSAQSRVVAEVEDDLQQPHPMLRLVQGDVGSGKTVVAAYAMLIAIESGYQAALLAPTELLTVQHYQNFKKWLEPLGITVALLTSQVKGAKRKEVLAQIQSGEAQVVIGTHAVFQAQVEFKHLSLVVVDEQHRFGVQQRLQLTDKGKTDTHKPHQLIMSATPIPRTLAMSAYADLDVSIIDELPPGRTPVKTVVMSNSKRDEVIAHVNQSCQEGRQACWVCTLITESEMLQCQTAEDTADKLQKSLPNLKVGMVHGKMKPADKEQIMAQFKNAELDVLVATTVIEVGVDVPNASLMIIENPERLGLAQLHQLRGRVGRGTAESFCVLMYQHPLSSNASERLSTLRETQDGFKVAEKDLELRGPGELLGTRQTGLENMHVADLMRDRTLLPRVQKAADAILQDYPERSEQLIARWLSQKASFAEV